MSRGQFLPDTVETALISYTFYSVRVQRTG